MSLPIDWGHNAETEQRRLVERAEDDELQSGSFGYRKSALSVSSVDAAETLARSPDR